MLNHQCMLNYNYILPLRNLICYNNIHKLLLTAIIKTREISHTRMFTAFVFYFNLGITFSAVIIQRARLPLCFTVGRTLVPPSSLLYTGFNLFKIICVHIQFYIPLHKNIYKKTQAGDLFEFCVNSSLDHPSARPQHL